VVLFKGEVPQATLALAMQQASALILCSRYESFGCVLIEANACGLPVILSNLPVFHELISDGQNGMFIKENTALALCDCLLAFAKQKHSFDKNNIAAITKEKYSYDVVGKKIQNMYTAIINKND